MFKLSEIKDLIKLVDQSSLQELEIQNEGYKLSIRKPNKTESVIVAPAPVQHHAGAAPYHQPAVTVPAEAEAAAQPQMQAASPSDKTDDTAGLHKIVSPMVGTYYGSPSPDAGPFVNVGDKVQEKTVVCIVEAMKLMNEIEAEVKGEIVDILVENGQLVEYGQPLFLVRV